MAKETPWFEVIYGMTFNISTINICVIADQSRNSLFASAIKIYVPDPSWQSIGLEIVEALGVSAFRNNIRCGINEAVPWVWLDLRRLYAFNHS